LLWARASARNSFDQGADISRCGQRSQGLFVEPRFPHRKIDIHEPLDIIQKLVPVVFLRQIAVSEQVSGNRIDDVLGHRPAHIRVGIQHFRDQIASGPFRTHEEKNGHPCSPQ